MCMQKPQGWKTGLDQAVHLELLKRMLSDCILVLAQLLVRIGATLEEILEQYCSNEMACTYCISPFTCDDSSDSSEGYNG